MASRFSSSRRSQDSFGSQSGFALIITITLMAFLVLLLVSMTVLTRVETRTASNSQQMSLAQENALLALNVAVGQLQRYAGPDQRVTAHSGIDLANSNNPFWTGVWDEGTMGNSPDAWLVSGNEDPANPIFVSPARNLNASNQSFSQPFKINLPSTPGAQVDWVRLVNPAQTPSNGSWVGGVFMPSGSWEGGVVVPRVPLRTRGYPGLDPNDDEIIGHYAYWVGDQGTKASLGLKERHKEAYTNQVQYKTQDQQDDYHRRLRQLTSQRFWFGTDNNSGNYILRHFPQFDLWQLENRRLPLVLHKSQYSLPFSQYGSGNVNDGSFSPYTHPDQGGENWLNQGRPFLRDNNKTLRDEWEADLAINFHSITPRNHGVLTNSLLAGLRADLSFADPSAWTDDGKDEFRDFLEYGPTNAPPFPAPILLPMRTAATATPADDEPVFSLGPVLSEFVFRYSIYCDDTGALWVSVESEVELWNPYSTDLAPLPLLVLLEDLPVITVTETQTEQTREVDLGAMFANLQTATLPAIPAGSVQVSSPPLSAPLEAPVAPITDPTSGITPSQYEFTLSSASSTVTAEVWLDVSAAVGGDPSPLPQVPLGRFVCSATDGSEFDPVQVGPYPAQEDEWRFGFYARLIDGDDRPTWLETFDPRMLGLSDAFEIVVDPAGAATRALNESWDPHRLQPASGLQPVVSLFEIPLQETVSLAALQHLQFHGRPAYALGNNWGGSINDLLDSYFISTVPQNGSWAGEPGATGGLWDFPLANTRHVPYRSVDSSGNEIPYTADLQAADSAQHLLVEGMFNINSTSVNAWRSVLGAVNIRGDSTSDYNPDPDSTANPNGYWWLSNGQQFPLEHAVFRFSQTADLVANYIHQNGQFDTPQLQKLESQPAAAYVQGVRELTEQQLTDLAVAIVDELQLKGRPYYSLSEFVQDGALERAILASNINGSLPLYAPSYITEGDILTALAPYMAVRSDTFLVRAYGDAYDPVTKNRTTAYCEAVVQRVPTPLDPSDAANPATFMNPNGQFGRKFEIVYFRWMNPGDL